MIPDAAVEEALARLPMDVLRYIDADDMRRALEAAAPHLMVDSRDDWEAAEERVKEIIQEVAMTVDYTPRLYDAGQKILKATLGPKPERGSHGDD